MKMLCTLLVLALFTSTLSAQNDKHEISVGYGIGTSNEFAGLFDDIIMSAFSGGHYNVVNEDFSGAFHLAYKYLVTEKIGVGGSFVYQNSKADIHENGQQTADLKRNFYVLAAEADYRYIARSNFTLYSGLGAGYTLMNEKVSPESGGEKKDNTGSFNFQVTAIGARFGNNIGGFIEAGFGYKGIGSIGVFARF